MDDLKGSPEGGDCAHHVGRAGLVISTHNGAANPFNETIVAIRAGRLPYGLVRFDLDDALRAGCTSASASCRTAAGVVAGGRGRLAREPD